MDNAAEMAIVASRRDAECDRENRLGIQRWMRRHDGVDYPYDAHAFTDGGWREVTRQQVIEAEARRRKGREFQTGPLPVLSPGPRGEPMMAGPEVQPGAAGGDFIKEAMGRMSKSDVEKYAAQNYGLQLDPRTTKENMIAAVVSTWQTANG